MSLARYTFKLFNASLYPRLCGESVPKKFIEEKYKNIALLCHTSTIPNAGKGLFAIEDIKAGTVFGNPDSYSLVNDKTYNGNISTYLRLDDIEENTNTRIVEYNGDQLLQSLRDIKKGEELSRYYGPKCWIKINLATKHNRFINATRKEVIDEQADMIIKMAYLEHFNKKSLELKQISLEINDAFYDLTLNYIDHKLKLY